MAGSGLGCYTDNIPDSSSDPNAQIFPEKQFVYFEKVIEVTILDEDRTGKMRSKLTMDQWEENNQEKLEEFKTTMNRMFTDFYSKSSPVSII